MTKTERKQLRKAKAKAESYRRYKRDGVWNLRWPRTRLFQLMARVHERLNFLITEGRAAFWFRKRGLPDPSADNVRDDLKSITLERLNGGPIEKEDQ